MNTIQSASLALLLVCTLVTAQFGPPVGWDTGIIKKDSNMRVCRQWATSFESWDDFKNFDITPLNNGLGSAHTLTTARARSGKQSHMGIITSIEDPMHTGYPSVQLFKNSGANGGFSGGVYIEVWIWMDITISYDQWVTIGQLSPSTGSTPGARFISLDIGEGGYLQIGNAPDPGYAFHVYQNYFNMFPRRQWVNVTTYVNFDPDNGYAAVWQDGTLQSVSKVNGGNYRLNQLHFGLFAQNLIPSGVIYNDDLTITEVTTNGQACPADAYIQTLPPTNPPEVIADTSNDLYEWVDFEDSSANVLSIGLMVVCSFIATLLML